MRELKTSRITIPAVDEHDHVEGPVGAAITLVQYADFECLYSGDAYPIVKEIRKLLKNELRFVFRHFPLTNTHHSAQFAAEAAEAAGVQGKFWEMHDYLFEHQNELDLKHIKQFAETLHLDMKKFNRDITEHRYSTRVREDFVNGFKGGVTGTPTFFINGMRYDESWDLNSLLEAILLGGGSSSKQNYARCGS